MDQILNSTLFQDIQKQIDDLGYITVRDVTGATSNDMLTAPIPVRDESEWYENVMSVSQGRIQRYGDFEDMDNHPLMASILDIYSQESTRKDAWNNVVKINTNNSNIKLELEELLFKRLNINFRSKSIIRDMCKYGDKFQFLVLQKDRKGILYLKDMPAWTVFRLEHHDKLVGFVQYQPTGVSPVLDPFSVIHWRLGLTRERYKPYGTSLLEPTRRHYRQLKLMEDAMTVYRVTRAPERRMFFISVGRLAPQKAEEYIQKIVQKWRKAPMTNKQTNSIDWKSHSMAPDEDFYIPVRDGQDGTRIEQLPGGQNLSEIDDVKWFKDQILSYVKIPRIYLNDPEGGAAERRENLAQQDVRFAAAIDDVQEYFLESLTKICVIHLLLRGYKKSDALDFSLQATQSSYAAEQLRMEVENSRFALVDTMVSAGLPKSYAMFRVLQLPKNEITKLTKMRRAEDLFMARREAEVEAFRSTMGDALSDSMKQYIEKNGVFDPKLSFLKNLPKPDFSDFESPDTGDVFQDRAVSIERDRFEKKKEKKWQDFERPKEPYRSDGRNDDKSHFQNPKQQFKKVAGEDNAMEDIISLLSEDNISGGASYSANIELFANGDTTPLSIDNYKLMADTANDKYEGYLDGVDENYDNFRISQDNKLKELIIELDIEETSNEKI